MRLSRVRERLLGSQLVRQTLAYGVVKGVSVALSVAIGPILTHYLVPADYGIAALFVAAFNFLDPVVGLGVGGAFRRRYFQQSEYHYASYVTSGTLFCLAQAVLMTLLLLASYPLWGTPEVSRVWALTFLPWVVGRYFISAASVQLQLAKRPLAFGAFAWASNIANAAVTLTLVVGAGLGWEGRVLGQTSAALAVGSVALVVLFKLVGRGRWSWPLVKDALAFGAPGVPYGLLGRGIQFGDRVVIAAMLGVDAAGLYTIGAQISGLMAHVATSFNLAWQPWLYEQLKSDDPRARRRVVLALYVGSVGILASSVCLWLSVRWLFPLVIGDRYLAATALLPWLCIGGGLRGIALLLAGFITYSGRTIGLTRIAMLVVVAHVVGLVVLIRANGNVGAAQATFLACAFNLLLVWRTARRMVPLRGL